MVNIAIVEDDKFLLPTLNLVLQKAENINVLGTYCNPGDALLHIPQLKPDIVLMDLNIVRRNI